MEIEKINKVGEILNNKEKPLKERFRALFTLKNIGGNNSIEWINKCFDDESALLKHELAYCLGQMQDKNAIPILNSVLNDTKQEAMVRHEAAEALGAIGSIEVIPMLEKYVNDSIKEISETCEIALDRVKWYAANENEFLNSKSPYKSIDPTPTLNINDIQELKAILLDENENLFKRYRAMFTLRNINTDESCIALSEGLKCKSALFRHEIAFVLGQLQQPVTVPYLIENLNDITENEMVRHECAEALGSIATDDCITILNKYLDDDKRVVKESCIVALDMCDYEKSTDFQYANTLGQINM